MGIKVGDKLKDNDPRVGNRILTVREIGHGFVEAKAPSGRIVSIRTDRIHTDGKPRRSGFDLIRDNAKLEKVLVSVIAKG